MTVALYPAARPPEPEATQTLRSERPESLWADAWKRLRRNRAAVRGKDSLVPFTI